MVDLAPVAEILVAIGTLSLAFLTYETIRENRKQLSLLSSRTAIERSRLEPYLLVKSIEFERNQLKLTVENRGRGHASWLGINSSFYPAEPRSYADRNLSTPISHSEVIERQSRGLTAWGTFQPSRKPLSYANYSQVFPVPIVTFLMNKEFNDTVLTMEETREFVVEPFFGFETERKLGDSPSSWQGLQFGDLREFLDKNGIQYVALELYLVCKDVTDEFVPSPRICRFVFDMSKHQSLEEAYKENRGFSFTPIGLREMGQIEFLPASTYHELKTPRSRPEPWKVNDR